MEDCGVAFDNRFTQSFGVPIERIRTKVKDYLSPSKRSLPSPNFW